MVQLNLSIPAGRDSATRPRRYNRSVPDEFLFPCGRRQKDCPTPDCPGPDSLRAHGLSGEPVIIQTGFGPKCLGLAAESSDPEERTRLLRAQQMEWLGTLAAGVAHDFNHILQLILSCADLASEVLDQPDQARELLRDIQRAVVEARQYTHQLMTLANTGQARPQLVDLAVILRELNPLLVRLVGSVGIQLDLGEGLVLGHAWQLRQLVLNLVMNAAESYEGRAGNVEVSLWSDAEQVCLRVKDRGCGMSPEALDRVFQPFVTTKAHNGRGLGLSLVSAIVEHHEATLMVDTLPGVGSTFSVSFKAY